MIRYDIEIKVVQYGDDGKTISKTGTEVRSCGLTDTEVVQVLGRIRKFLDGLPDGCVDPNEPDQPTPTSPKRPQGKLSAKP